MVTPMDARTAPLAVPSQGVHGDGPVYGANYAADLSSVQTSADASERMRLFEMDDDIFRLSFSGHDAGPTSAPTSALPPFQTPPAPATSLYRQPPPMPLLTKAMSAPAMDERAVGTPPAKIASARASSFMGGLLGKSHW